MSNENTTATSNKRAHDDVNSANSPVSALKKQELTPCQQTSLV